MWNDKLYASEVERCKAVAARTDLNDQERAQLSSDISRLAAAKREREIGKAVEVGMKDVPSEDAMHGFKAPGVVESASGMSAAVPGSNGSLYQAIRSKGFDLQSKPKVEIGSVVSTKAVMADGSDAAIMPLLGIVRTGADMRFAYQAFPSTYLGGATAVSGLIQSARALADPTAMDIPLTGSSVKPESVVSAALTTVDARMLAHVTELLPNAIYNRPEFAAFIQQEMAFGLGRGLDKYLLTQLAAATGTTLQVQGAELFMDTYRLAIGAARSAGHSPDLAILHPNDAVNLSIFKDANDRYYGTGPTGGGDSFPSVWGVRIVESISATEKFPILVDTSAYGKFFSGGATWSANPYEEFRTNRTRGRLEVPVCLFIQKPSAIVEITLN